MPSPESKCSLARLVVDLNVELRDSGHQTCCPRVRSRGVGHLEITRITSTIPFPAKLVDWPEVSHGLVWRQAFSATLIGVASGSRECSLDRSDGKPCLRNAGISLKLWCALFPASRRGQPPTQQPCPCVAKQSCILYSNHRILSGFEGQQLIPKPVPRSFPRATPVR